MTEIRVKPCGACPYKISVPSGIWSYDEYEKLRAYDAPTAEQPVKGFACHASPEFYCHGWGVCHTSRDHRYDLLALRFDPPANGIPEPVVELFETAADAADHGQRDVEEPSDVALETIDKLVRRHDRLKP